MTIEQYMQTVGQQARAASHAIARADSNAKAVLVAMASYADAEGRAWVSSSGEPML